MENMKKNQLCIKAPDKETARKILQIITECTNLTDLFYDGEYVDTTVRFECDDCDGCEIDCAPQEDEDDFGTVMDNLFGTEESVSDMLFDLENIFVDIDDNYRFGKSDEYEGSVSEALEKIEDIQDALSSLSVDVSLLPKHSRRDK